ncbi:MAG TPA: DUF6259 domain-containing protein [Candidatus Hydrogenedentes bacterium]|nr:DUF6259 domain-containing protein [Candidatus Hydrogenedentota bacterium]HPG70328.1 DUF6259 domain-containing protein [Candidatus Hydrogenedentota bacterium]
MNRSTGLWYGRGACVAWAALVVFVVQAAGLTIESASFRLGVDTESARIVELAKPDSGPNLVDPDADTPLWQVDFGRPGQTPLVPSDAGEFEVLPSDVGDDAFRVVWSDFGVEAAPALRVVVDVALDAATAVSHWAIAVEGLDDARPVSVRFPRVGGLVRQKAETLAVPIWMGEETHVPRAMLNADGQGRRLEWTYPGILSMQCLAFYGAQGSGFYAACDDTAAFGKRFAFFGDGRGGAGFEVVQLPENAAESAGAYRAPYRVQLGVFDGDWFTAAERYRAWALQQPWAGQSRLRTGVTPAWCIDTGLWIWNRGRSENVLGPAAALQEAAGVPVSVFWHWWHGCAYDTGFPEYLPPREGAGPFKDAVGAAHGEGLHAIVYMNQRLWGMTTESWKERDAARYAVKGPDGEIRPEVYNTFTKAPCASMCMGTAFWRSTYAGLATEAVLDLGVDGIYMDQACSSLACYDANHGHPIGGGTYWIKGFQALQQDIRDRCTAGGRSAALAGEGCGEAWLPYLDLMLSLQVSMERYAAPGQWRPIPFFHAVYHGYSVPYGNYASLTMPPYDELWPEETAPAQPLALLDRKFAPQFRMEQARAFVWGQVPTVANFRPDHLESRADEMAFALGLARLRQRAVPFLLYGTMLRPPVMDIAEADMPISRLSIYAGQQGALSEYEARYPLVLASCWRSPEGNVAVVVTNIADTPQRVTFTVDADTWPIARQGTVRILEHSGAERSAAYVEGHAAIDEDLAPASGCVYVFGGE